jgi:hypothetical protein
MEINRYKTAGQWYKTLKKDGYQIPLTLYYELNKLSKEKGVSFQDAYKELSESGRIKIVDKTINFDLNEKK